MGVPPTGAPTGAPTGGPTGGPTGFPFPNVWLKPWLEYPGWPYDAMGGAAATDGDTYSEGGAIDAFGPGVIGVSGTLPECIPTGLDILVIARASSVSPSLIPLTASNKEVWLLFVVL